MMFRRYIDFDGPTYALTSCKVTKSNIYLIGTFIIQQLTSINTDKATSWNVIQATQAPTSEII